MAHDTTFSEPDFQQFFSDKARAFSQGNFDAVVDALGVPTPVYVLDNLLVVSSLSDASGMLGIYHGNLLKLGYAHTQTELKSLACLGRERVKATAISTHFDAGGAVLSSFEVEYYLRAQGKLCTWQIDMIATFSPPLNGVLDGLPLI